MEPKKPFWKWVFCESDGTPSFARVFTGLIVCFELGWVTAIVWMTHAVPSLGDLSLFAVILYGANKVANLGVLNKQ